MASDAELTVRGIDVRHQNWMPIVIVAHVPIERKGVLVAIVEPKESLNYTVKYMPTEAFRDLSTIISHND